MHQLQNFEHHRKYLAVRKELENIRAYKQRRLATMLEEYSCVHDIFLGRIGSSWGVSVNIVIFNSFSRISVRNSTEMTICLFQSSRHLHGSLQEQEQGLEQTLVRVRTSEAVSSILRFLLFGGMGVELKKSLRTLFLLTRHTTLVLVCPGQGR